MKKFNFLKFSLALALLSGSAQVASAQVMPHFETNWYSEYVGNRISVVAPTNLAKPLMYTIAKDGPDDATSQWGPNSYIPATGILDKDLVATAPYDACGTLTNGAAIAGKVALLQRGDCEFGVKAKNAQDAGALAVFIVNNVDGPPVGMGAGAVGSQVNIPVIMISKAEGAILKNALDNSVNVKVSLSIWGNNFTNDLGIVVTGGATNYASAIPYSQLSNASGVSAYSIVPGAVIANFGSATLNNVVIGAKLTWFPDNGNPSVVFDTNTSTAPIVTFAPTDSIVTPFIDKIYNLPNTTTTGHYELEYTASSDETDEYPNDNTATYTMNVTPNTFSRTSYDLAKTQPNYGSYFGFASGNEFVFGPMMYVAKGDYKVENLQVSVTTPVNADPEDNSLVDFGILNVIIWKWSDANSDNVMQAGEVTKVGLATHEMVEGDTQQQIFTLPVTSFSNTTAPMITENNSWYWTTAIMPANTFLGCDGQSNFQPRSYFKNNVTTGASSDFFAPIFAGTDLTFTDDPSNPALMYPFEATNNPDSVRFAQQRKGAVAGISWITSVFPSSVKEVNNTVAANIELYPNPAVDVMNVSVKLDNEAKKVYYTIVDQTGRKVSEVAHRNVTNETYQIPTGNLAAGTYFLIINVDGKPSVKQFSIVK